MIDSEKTTGFEGWVILELMGHRRLAGFLREQSLGGASFLRIDVPGEDGNVATQFYSGASVYCITPTTEDVARKVAQLSRVEPVTAWELEKPKALPVGASYAEDDEDDDKPF